MNRKLVLAAALVAAPLLGATAWAQEKAPKKIELKTTDEKAIYAAGALTAKNMRHQFELMGVELDLETLLRGFRDGLGNGKLALTDDEMDAALQAQSEDVFQRNGEQGEAFLEANKKKKDVVTLPSGLQYKIVKKGTGKTPTLRDSVTVNYRGRLLNGKVFDSSDMRKEPLTIGVDRVIDGWKEALPLMPVGSKWEIYVPADLAYGPPGNGTVPPNATLVFDVELLDILKPPAAGAMRSRPQQPEDLK